MTILYDEFKQIATQLYQWKALSYFLTTYELVQFSVMMSVICQFRRFESNASSSGYRAASSILTNPASEVAEWAKSKSLLISLIKSHSSLFTSDNHQSHIDPSILLEGDLLDGETPQDHGSHLRHPLHLHSSYISTSSQSNEPLGCATQRTSRRLTGARRGNSSCHLPSSLPLNHALCIAGPYGIPIPPWAGCIMPACALHPDYFESRQSVTCKASVP